MLEKSTKKIPEFHNNYKIEDPDADLKETIKRLKSDLESMTARVMLQSLPSSNAYRDAQRLRKRYGFGEIIK